MRVEICFHSILVVGEKNMFLFLGLELVYPSYISHIAFLC